MRGFESYKKFEAKKHAFFFLLAGAVKTFADVDLFVLPDPKKNEKNFNKLIKCISNLCVSHPQKRSRTEREEFYLRTFKIIRVIDIGRLQIIFCFHPSYRCNFHLDRKFFINFHHVTRYRLLVYHKKSDNGQLYDLWFTVYIPYAKELGLITENIQIDKNAIKN